MNQQNFLQLKEYFSLAVYQRNVSLIQRNCILGVLFDEHYLFVRFFFIFHIVIIYSI